MEKYRIIRYERLNKKGEEIVSKFYIQTYIKILRWKFWYFVGRTSKTKLLPFVSENDRIAFKFLGEAQHHIEDVLMKNKPYNTEIYKVVENG